MASSATATSSLRSEDQKATTQAVSLSSAGLRALIYQLSAIYLRTPIKLFKPSRFDYMVYVREQANRHFGLPSKPYKFHTHSSLAMIINVTKREGWRFIPDHLLPPLLANSATGFILYGTYLTSLNAFDNRRHLMKSEGGHMQEINPGKQNLKKSTKQGRERELKSKDAETESKRNDSRHDYMQDDGHDKRKTTNLEKSSPESSDAKFLVKGYSPVDTWKAGFIAGAVQSLVAAPIDAIYSRSSTAELLSGKHENLWKYGAHKLKEIGLMGVFAGYAFSLVKESFGFAFYFSTFEVVKTKGYNLTYGVISAYRNLRTAIREKFSYWSGDPSPKVNAQMVRLEQARSTRFLRSSFILLAGASAALALLSVQYPISKLQKTHFHRLEALDIYNSSRSPAPRRPFFKLYYNSYLETLQYVQSMRRKSQLSWMQFAYKGFARNALTTIPATSVGLLVFEIMRTRVSDSVEILES